MPSSDSPFRGFLRWLGTGGILGWAVGMMVAVGVMASLRNSLTPTGTLLASVLLGMAFSAVGMEDESDG